MSPPILSSLKSSFARNLAKQFLEEVRKPSPANVTAGATKAVSHVRPTFTKGILGQRGGAVKAAQPTAALPPSVSEAFQSTRPYRDIFTDRFERIFNCPPHQKAPLFDVNAARGTLLIAHALKKGPSPLLSWQQFNEIARNPRYDHRRVILERLGVFDAIQKKAAFFIGRTNAGLVSDFDINVVQKEALEILLKNVKSMGYHVQEESGIYRVKKLDLVLWDATKESPLQKKNPHSEYTNTILEEKTLLPGTLFIGQLNKLVHFNHETAQSLKNKTIFQLYEDLKLVTKQCYKAVNHVRPNGHQPNSQNYHPFLERLYQFKEQEISPTEFLNIYVDPKATPHKQLQQYRRQMIAGILKTRAQVWKYLNGQMPTTGVTTEKSAVSTTNASSVWRHVARDFELDLGPLVRVVRTKKPAPFSTEPIQHTQETYAALSSLYDSLLYRKKILEKALDQNT